MRALPGIPVLLAVVLLLFSGCEEKVRPSVVAVQQMDIPSQESWNSTVMFTDSARVTAILWAGHIASYANRQYTLLGDSVHVDFFDEFERHTSRLTARSGRVNERTQDLDAYEHVLVVSDSGTVLKTDSLFWNNASRQIHTPAFVEITSPTERIMGHGMVSDQGLKNYRIFRVTGQAVTHE